MKNKLNIKLMIVLCAIVFSLLLPSISGFAEDSVAPRGEYYLDDADVLSEQTKSYITERNYNLEHNAKGAQICVVVVRSIGGTDISTFAENTFNKWQIGRSSEGNGLLFLVVASGNAAASKYWITPGIGLEELFSASALKAIFDKYYIPSANEGDLDAAIRDTFAMLNSFVCKKYDADPAGKASTNLSGGTGFVSGGGQNGFGFMSCSDFESNADANMNLIAFDACSSCSSACSSCNSCAGFGGIILIVVLAYIALQVFKYIGHSSRAAASGQGGGSFFFPFLLGSIARGFANSARSSVFRRAGSRSYNGSRANRNPYSASRFGSSGFKGGGGTTRGGGFGSSGPSGFKGGGGGTRGGGFGKK